MKIRQVVLLCCCLLLDIDAVLPQSCTNVDDFLTERCFKQLGGVGRSVEINCDTPGRESPNVDWFHNGIPLDTSGNKYSESVTENKLTINDVGSSDEGNYSCDYINSGGAVCAGCLIVYGSAYYTLCEENTCAVSVSNHGKITFNLSISFREAGPSGNVQTVKHTVLKKGSMIIATCSTNGGCNFDNGNRWWTVFGVETVDLVLILNQVISSDRAQYTAETELEDPSTGGVDTLSKNIAVTGALCNVDPPNITLAAMSTLESTSIDIVGAQANYSCNGDCTLNGSSSLRCMRGMQSLNDYMWLDENGSDNYPNCVCSSAPTPTETVVSSRATQKATPTPTETVVSEKATQKGLSGGAIAGIIIALLVVMAVILSALGVLMMRGVRSHLDGSEGKGHVVSDSDHQVEVVLKQYETHKNEDQQKYTRDDNNRDSFIERNVSLGSGNEDSDSESSKNSPPSAV